VFGNHADGDRSTHRKVGIGSLDDGRQTPTRAVRGVDLRRSVRSRRPV